MDQEATLSQECLFLTTLMHNACSSLPSIPLPTIQIRPIVCPSEHSALASTFMGGSWVAKTGKNPCNKVTLLLSGENSYCESLGPPRATPDENSAVQEALLGRQGRQDSVHPMLQFSLVSLDLPPALNLQLTCSLLCLIPVSCAFSGHHYLWPPITMERDSRPIFHLGLLSAMPVAHHMDTTWGCTVIIRVKYKSVLSCDSSLPKEKVCASFVSCTVPWRHLGMNG